MTHNYHSTLDGQIESHLIIEDSIIGQFEKTVDRFADKVGLRDDTRSLTYEEINRRVNRITHAALHEIQQGHDGLSIALLFDHDVYAVLGVMAALKTGKPYLPLAPWQPRSRSQIILETGNPCVLITNDKNLSFATSIVELLAEPIPVINIDQLPESLPDTNPVLDQTPDLDDPFCILHTSGSTGAPKAIVRSHRTMLDTLREKVITRDFNDSSNSILYILYTAGASRGTMIGTLLVGATLNVYDMKRLGVTPLTTYMQERQITGTNMMPTILRRWLDTMTGPVDLPHLHDLRLAGEPVVRSDIERIIRLLPDHVTITISLAAGEIGSYCIYEIDRDNLFEGETVPLGYAAEGRKVRLLDDDDNPVPDGEVGQFVVTAAHIRPTYIFDEELSRTKFQPDPDDPSMLRYFTGDLGRLRPDGMYEFVGRKDSMVKVRGHQVVTNDLEDILHEHPAINEVAVKPTHIATGDVRIAAYYSLAAGANDDEVSASTLREWLGQRVPDYMLPSYFIHLDTFPLTDTGKVNRPALPEPEHVRPDIDAHFASPGTPLEIQLVRIWEDVLGLSPVGIDDGFFDLGGHSLLASQVVFEIAQQLGIQIKMAALSQAPTVRRLAAVLQDYQPDAALPSLVPIQPEGTRPRLYCIHPRGGLVGLYYHLSRNLGPDQPVYGLQAQGLDGLRDPHRTIAEMAAHYIAEIKAAQPEGPYHLAGFSLGGMIIHEMACQLAEQGDAVGLIALLDSRVPRTRVSWVATRLGRRLQIAGRIADTIRRALDQSLEIMGQHPIHRWLPEINARRRHIEAVREEQAADRAGISDPFNQPEWTPERRVLWANRKAGDDHNPRVYPGPVTFFLASESKPGHQNPQTYWRTLAAGEVTVVEIPGTHRSIMEEPGVRVLAARVSEALERASATG